MYRIGRAIGVSLFLIMLAWGSFYMSVAAHAHADWTRLDGPLVPGGVVLDLAEAPSDPSKLYALVDHPSGVRLFQSGDRALSWTQTATVTGILPPTSTPELVIDPGDDKALYLATGSSVYRSTDGGLAWTEVLTTGLWLAAPEPSTLYVVGKIGDGSNECSGVWQFARSDDAGESWQHTLLPCIERVVTLSTTAADPQTIYLAVSHHERTMLVSRDGGQSWTSNRSLPSSVQMIAVDPTDSDHLLAGTFGAIMQSRDGGETWTPISSPLLWIWDSLEVFFAAEGTAYFSAFRPGLDPHFDEWIPALYRSDDGGQTWWMATEPLPDRWSTIIVAPDNPSLLYARTAGKGIFRSDSGGSTWQEQNSGIVSPVAIGTIEVLKDGVIYVGASRYGRSRHGLFRSGDGGLSWTTVLTDTYVEQMVVDPQEQGALATGSGRLYQGYRLADGIQWHADSLWMAPTRMHVSSIDISSANSNIRIIGGHRRIFEYQYQGVVGIWRIGGAGSSPGWELIEIDGAYFVDAVLIDSAVPTRIYVSATMSDTTSSILRSEDGGATWHKSNVPTNEYGFSVRVSRFYWVNGRLFGIGFGAIFSDDDGENWQEWLYRFMEGHRVGQICDLAGSMDGQIFIAAEQDIYRWNAFIGRWEPLNLPIDAVSSLAIVEEEGEEVIYAGTDLGIWKRTVPAPATGTLYIPTIQR
jgi:photosystem II stability/assembly factor-like uncharacterized protein